MAHLKSGATVRPPTLQFFQVTGCSEGHQTGSEGDDFLFSILMSLRVLSQLEFVLFAAAVSVGGLR